MNSIRQHLLTRREALRHISAGALLSLGLWPGALRAADSIGGRTFRFVVVNDTHCLSPECGPWLETVVRDMRKQGPAFCLHAGDLTDKGEAEHLATVCTVFAGLGDPAYFVPGNHDYVTQADRTTYDAALPGQLNYYFTWEGWQFIALDTTEGQKYEKTIVQPATLSWVDENVPKLDRRKPTVILTHFPLGTGVKMRPLNADALLDRFRDLNLQAVFCGHYHAFTEGKFRGAPVTTNKCCSLKKGNHDGTKAKGYFLCTAKDGRIQREFVEVKVPGGA